MFLVVASVVLTGCQDLHIAGLAAILGGSAPDSFALANVYVPAPAPTHPPGRTNTAPGVRPPPGRLKSGTGFFVSPDGLLATSAHVIEGCRQVQIWPRGGDAVVGNIVALDRDSDVALLSTGYRAVHYAPVEPSTPIAVGARTSTIGYGVIASQPRKPVLYQGIFLGTAAAATRAPLLVIRSRLHAGNSGGPVIDADDKLLGMVIGRNTDQPDRGLAVPRSEIAGLLQGAGYTPAAEPLVRARKPRPRDFLLEISALVQCLPEATASDDPRANPRPSVN